MRTLGNSIDTSFVDLKGGTTGQVLAKASNTDLDYTWVAQDDSNAIQNAIVDAKGDLISATAADTPARLAVGTNGQVLSANSATATGLEWTTISTSPTFVGASVYSTTGTTCANNTYTTLLWGNEDFDTDSFHSTSTNTGRMTIPTGKGGKYQVNALVNTNDNSATGARRLRVTKNGSNVKETLQQGQTVYPSIQVSLIVNCVAGDYLEIVYMQESGSSQTVEIGASYGHFSVAYLGA